MHQWVIVGICYLYFIQPVALYNVTHITSNQFNTFEYTNLTFSHAESPVWDPDSGTLYWVDVLQQDVHSLDYKSKQHKVKHINYGEVNIVIPVKNSSRVLVGVRNELHLMDWTKPGDSALRFVAAFDQGLPDNILNEGKVDALGRFWGGTKGNQHGNEVVHDEGALYSLEPPHFVPQIRLKPVSISNGLVWALNNSILYYIDSLSRKIEAFEYNLGRAHISKRRTILELDQYWDNEVIADGMTIDKDGLIWIALMFDGCIVRINPDTKTIVERYKLPVTLTTSLTWGGPNLDHLIVTTSRRNMSPETLKEQPLAGAVFILHNMGTAGVKEHKFVFPNADTYK